MFRLGTHLKRSVRNGNGLRSFSKFSEFKDSRTRGPITFFSLGFTVITACGIVAYYNIEKEKKTKALARSIKTVGKPALGGPWVLVNSDGATRTDASYRGQFMILYFGFTYCPDICPSELVKVGSIMKALEKKKINQVKPVFISVDPNRDTVGQLKNYSQDFHPSIDYLTGTREQVSKAAKAYRVYFSKANENENDDEDYLVDHSIVLYLVSPEGEFVDFFTQRTEVGDVVERIEKYVKDYEEILLKEDSEKK
mmetsp:Transcript_59060/g.116173  ORF Transcript_59060/g.116173 Transcript_59060/m.116173 type:complete len:253 (-) Transcript_59060:154-912(-)